MRKITISIEENVYNDLHRVIGQGKISHFINEIVKPYIMSEELDKAYKAMSEDKEREKEASEWTEGLIGDVGANPEDDSKWN